MSAVVNSSSPASQNLYGSFGRNTGFITYIVLLAISVSALTLDVNAQVLKELFTVYRSLGLINVIYCAWVILFLVTSYRWNNPYGNILGLFGNPNFISAFLGNFHHDNLGL
jgi:hypothetical protein